MSIKYIAIKNKWSPYFEHYLSMVGRFPDTPPSLLTRSSAFTHMLHSTLTPGRKDIAPPRQAETRKGMLMY